MAEAICIQTPMGLKCSASPVKSHVPGAQNCAPSDPAARRSVAALKAATQRYLLDYLGMDWSNPAWSDPPPDPGTDPDRARAHVIARVIELMYAVQLEDDTLFIISKLSNQDAAPPA